MARMKNGPYGPFVGRIGNTVGYLRFGQPIIRILSNQQNQPAKKKTDKQKAAFDRMRVMMEFVSPANDFFNASFKLAVRNNTRIPQNEAVSLNIKSAITGTYPELRLDYPKIIVSRGELLPAINPTISYEIEPASPHVAQAGIAIKFDWGVDPDWDYSIRQQQVMMLAYCPANKSAFYAVSGARRSVGSDTLQGTIFIKDQGTNVKDNTIETYISFVSDDRESISDSTYTGQIILPL